MNKEFQSKKKTLVIVDMQYEMSDEGDLPTQGWKKVVENAKKVLTTCREENVPVIYVRAVRNPDGSDSHRFDLKSEDGLPLHSVENTRATQIAEELQPKPDEVIINKQRWSAFFQTNLEKVLQELGAEQLIMMGVFTDSCFLTSVYDAFFRGYDISIVKDACGAGTDAAHKTSILDMANWVYGCSIFKADEMMKALKGEDYKAWFWEKPNSMAYDIENIEYFYEKIGE